MVEKASSAAEIAAISEYYATYNFPHISPGIFQAERERERNTATCQHTNCNLKFY